ncbi:AzlC family ABC transporter permease [Brachybacterium halotolerans]
MAGAAAPEMIAHAARSRRAGEIASIAGSVLLVGVSYGALADGAHLPLWFVLLLACTVLGASSELVFVGAIAGGASPVLAVVGALLLNLRNGLYGVSVARFLPRGATRLLDAHLVNDETAAYGLAQPDAGTGRRAFRVLGVAIAVAWPAGAALGVLLGRSVPDPSSLGLDAVFPAILLAMLIGVVRDLRTGGLALGGAAAAVAVTPVVATGIAPLVALSVLVPGMLRGAWRRRRR